MISPLPKITVALFLFTLLASPGLAQDLIWYDKPAAVWEEAIPLGNGRIGAMVYGGAVQDLIKLNDDRLYSGEPGHRDVKLDIRKDFDQVLALLHGGKYAEATDFITRNWLGRSQAAYQPLGDLVLEFQHEGEVTAYRRELDLSDAVSRTAYTAGGAKFTREYFASHPAGVLVIRLSSDKPGSLNLRVRLSSVHPTATTRVPSVGELAMKGQLPGVALGRKLEWIEEKGDQWKYTELFDKDGRRRPGAKQLLYGEEAAGRGMYFEARVLAKISGGRIEPQPDHLEIVGADQVLLLLATGSSFNGFNRSPSREGLEPSAQCTASLQAAAKASFSRLLEDHVRDYRSLFGRVTLDLGPASDRSKLPTDQRIRRYAEGGDERLAATYFQFGRYLMIAGSRPGTQPLNLQGIWNPHLLPPWYSAYTVNINTEMNYWPAETTNLSECHEPLLRMIEELSLDGRKVAREVYGRAGWVSHHNTTIWRDAQPVDGNARACFWPLSAGWFCEHLWDHYQFTGDTQFLQKAYPVMKSAAEFLLEWLVEDEKGRLVTPVSTSPENEFVYTEPGSGARKRAAVSQGSTMDIAIIRELFTNCVEASRILRVDAAFRQILEEKTTRLLPYQVGAKGQLQEWSVDFEEAEPEHRHVSHLYGLHPGNQITRRMTPELFQAARRTLELRGDKATGWSIGWKMNLWARLEDGDHAYLLLRNLLGPDRTYPNLLDAHPPFQIDGNFGATAAIAEMLLQSHAGELHLLPALPGAWSHGKVTGLCARGGFTLDLEWDRGRLTGARLRSTLGRTATVRYGEKTVRIKTKAGGVYELNGLAGEK